MILLSTFLLALAYRDNAIAHPSRATATGEVIWPPEDGWIPPEALAPAVLPVTNFCLTARASLALGPTQPLSAPDPAPGHRPGYKPQVQRTWHPGSVQRKGHQARVITK